MPIFSLISFSSIRKRYLHEEDAPHLLEDSRSIGGRRHIIQLDRFPPTIRPSTERVGCVIGTDCAQISFFVPSVRASHQHVSRECSVISKLKNGIEPELFSHNSSTRGDHLCSLFVSTKHGTQRCDDGAGCAESGNGHVSGCLFGPVPYHSVSCSGRLKVKHEGFPNQTCNRRLIFYNLLQSISAQASQQLI
ncbi:hypothetical protein PUN28_011412 [Cardiocondyla obscurior]|uniref:Uncharacterized protein n=1 Tax=Cardiocondyla obscurior TaxID=286306 RepID=A0AAW2FEX6_9HYME